MSPRVVVDASLAIKWVVDEVLDAEARSLLDQWAVDQVRPGAPILLAYEAANVLHRRARRRELTPERARAALAGLLGMGLWWDADPATAGRALELARQLGLPAAYDAQYLAVAEREGCECWTADERLWNAVKDRLPWVHWIGSRVGERP